VSLLRAGVPLKIIGDVLGHTSAAATAEYLKLATEDLRSIGLDLPGEMLP
jgi:site-specific recombinase XerD